MTDLAKEELSTKNIVKVENKNWNWSNDTRKEPRFAILTVDKAQAEGTVITLDGLTSLMDNNQDMFQVTQGKVREGLPMLRAEVRLIGKEGLTGAERDAQRYVRRCQRNSGYRRIPQRDRVLGICPERW